MTAIERPSDRAASRTAAQRRAWSAARAVREVQARNIQPGPHQLELQPVGRGTERGDNLGAANRAARCYYPPSSDRHGGRTQLALGPIPINSIPRSSSWDGVPLQITWHGFFTAVGTLVGIWLAVRWATRAGFTEDDTFSVAMWGVIGAIVGARLFHVIDQWDFYSKDPISILKVNEGGLAIYGTIVGGPVAGAIYAWRKGFNVARLADIAAPPLVLGMAIGRIGDVINGEHHGAPARGLSAGSRLHQPELAGRDRHAGAPGRRLRADHGPGDLRRPGVARARLREATQRPLAIQLGAALPARRHAVLDVPVRLFARAASSSSSIARTPRSRSA